MDPPPPYPGTPHMDPPPPYPGTPRMHTIPLPEVDVPAEAVEINPILSVAHEHVLCDFSARVPGPFTPEYYNSPATQPPSRVFYCVIHEFSVRLEISTQDGEYVTIAHVLHNIHYYLHELVNPDLLAPANIGVDEFFIQRCMKITDPIARLDGFHLGIKRVDVLKGAHHFAGLVAGNGEWVLCLRE